MPCTAGLGPRHSDSRQQLLGPQLTMLGKKSAKGEGPGIVGVQVGQREAQHAQCIPRLVVLQEGQDAICRKKVGANR